MDWRERYADKLRTAGEAVRLINSGENVYIGMFGSTPEGLSKALIARSGELSDVSVYHYISPFPWGRRSRRQAICGW